MHHEVKVSRKVLRKINKLPISVQKKFGTLVDNLAENGPIQKNWPNFGKLELQRYHCHLGYHWVACWKHTKETITIEVYYVGSRENAPY